LRGIGAFIFFFVGVTPLMFFIVRGIVHLKPKATKVEEMDVDLFKTEVMEEKVTKQFIPETAAEPVY